MAESFYDFKPPVGSAMASAVAAAAAVADIINPIEEFPVSKQEAPLVIQTTEAIELSDAEFDALCKTEVVQLMIQPALSEWLHKLIHQAPNEKALDETHHYIRQLLYLRVCPYHFLKYVGEAWRTVIPNLREQAEAVQRLLNASRLERR